MLYYFLIFSTCLFIVSCQETNDEGSINDENTNKQKKKEESNMTKEELYDFYYIKKAPKANDVYGLDEVIKVLVTKNNSSLDDTIAIDVKNEKILVNPRMSSLGVRPRDGTKQVNDMESVLKILGKYDVQNWKEDYSFEDPSTYQDGYGWHLWLQFEDGTVEWHGGEGGIKSEITPDNFDEFFEELNEFVEERLKE